MSRHAPATIRHTPSRPMPGNAPRPHDIVKAASARGERGARGRAARVDGEPCTARTSARRHHAPDRAGRTSRRTWRPHRPARRWLRRRPSPSRADRRVDSAPAYAADYPPWPEVQARRRPTPPPAPPPSRRSPPSSPSSRSNVEATRLEAQRRTEELFVAQQRYDDAVQRAAEIQAAAAASAAEAAEPNGMPARSPRSSTAPAAATSASTSSSRPAIGRHRGAALEARQHEQDGRVHFAESTRRAQEKGNAAAVAQRPGTWPAGRARGASDRRRSGARRGPSGAGRSRGGARRIRRPARSNSRQQLAVPEGRRGEDHRRVRRGRAQAREAEEERRRQEEERRRQEASGGFAGRGRRARAGRSRLGAGSAAATARARSSAAAATARTAFHYATDLATGCDAPSTRRTVASSLRRMVRKLRQLRQDRPRRRHLDGLRAHSSTAACSSATANGSAPASRSRQRHDGRLDGLPPALRGLRGRQSHQSGAVHVRARGLPWLSIAPGRSRG